MKVEDILAGAAVLQSVLQRSITGFLFATTSFYCCCGVVWGTWGDNGHGDDNERFGLG